VKVTARLDVYCSGFLIFFDCHHFAALVLPTIGADRMRQAHPATVLAGYEVGGMQGVVGAAAVAAALRVFTLWLGCHRLLLYDYSKIAGRFVLSPLIIAGISWGVKKKTTKKSGDCYQVFTK
jgi:hypothetical protein